MSYDFIQTDIACPKCQTKLFHDPYGIDKIYWCDSCKKDISKKQITDSEKIEKPGP